MALNTSHLPNGDGVLIYNGEMILVYSNKVTMKFEKALEADMKGAKVGELFLTSHRIIFRNDDRRDKLQSFCMPFHCLRGVTLEQPVFGANYLKGGCLAQPGGNFEGEAQWSLTFSKGGCIDFGKALLQATDLATRFRPEHAPPPYAPPAGGYFSPPPSYYTPGDRPYHGFQPPVNVFPDAPPQNGVYMYEAPPPYAGIGGSAPAPNASTGNTPLPPYPAGGAGDAARAKENEANQARADANGTANGAANGSEAAPPSYTEATSPQPYQRR